MIYKNISNATKEFYGVRFKPGDIQEVPGYINDPKFVVAQKTDKIAVKASNKNKENQESAESEQVELGQGGER